MKIDDNHLYHGAALIQIAEHPRFTAINALQLRQRIVGSAYCVNTDDAVYFKYAKEGHGNDNEFTFTFHSDHIATVRAIAQADYRTFVALVCVSAREICVITADQLSEMIQRRQAAFGKREDQYALCVKAPARSQLRVGIKAPGVRRTFLGEPILVPRNNFPSIIFD